MRVALLGGGQLGRMIALAGHPLGIEFVTVSAEETPCAAAVSTQIRADFSDRDLPMRLKARADIATYETENLPLADLQRLAEHIEILPGLRSVELTSDRLVEKGFLRSLNLPTAPFVDITAGMSTDAWQDLGGERAILKTRREGYDGRGQSRVSSRDEFDRACAQVSSPCIAEGFVRFDREISVVAVRTSDDFRAYPIAQNIHREGILRVSIADATAPDARLEEAVAMARKIGDALQHVGVFAVEFFDTEHGLVVNEIAPRVHNSGHFTQVSSAVDQFENHVRAICGLPLGTTETEPRVHVMINMLGEVPPLRELLVHPSIRVEVYGKSARANRKVGHVSCVASSMKEAADIIDRLPSRLSSEFNQLR